jgi:hypothetical protein
MQQMATLHAEKQTPLQPTYWKVLVVARRLLGSSAEN